MARGKHSSAALSRRYAAAEQDIRDWKKQSAEQKREIARLTADVKLMPALRERVASLELQLSLATCKEIEELTRLVNEQRETIATLSEEHSRMRKRYERLVDRIPTDPSATLTERFYDIDDAVNGDEAVMRDAGSVIINPSSGPAVKRIGVEGARVLERARNRGRQSRVARNSRGNYE